MSSRPAVQSPTTNAAMTLSQSHDARLVATEARSITVRVPFQNAALGTAAGAIVDRLLWPLLHPDDMRDLAR